MAGVTSIINPAKDSEVLLFSISPMGYVDLATKATTDSKATGSTLGTQSATVEGPMMKKSTLASLRQGDLSTVYGLETHTINDGTGQKTVAQVTLISPVYQPLGLYSEPKYGRIATTLRPEDDDTYTAFLYYRKPDQLGTIYEYPLWDQDPNEAPYSPNHIGEETYLTTYYDTKNSARHIIYQGSNGGVHDYNITKDNRERIEELTDAISWTPLAAAWNAATSQVYLYYSIKSQGKHRLRRVIRSAEGNWGKPEFPPKAGDMKETTQLSATPTKGGCQVFYEGAKGGFQHYIDKW